MIFQRFPIHRLILAWKCGTTCRGNINCSLFLLIRFFKNILFDEFIFEISNRRSNSNCSQLSHARGPNNSWQEMAEWTRQGKLWTYPIDNEHGQRLPSEHDVS